MECGQGKLVRQRVQAVEHHELDRQFRQKTKQQLQLFAQLVEFQERQRHFDPSELLYQSFPRQLFTQLYQPEPVIFRGIVLLFSQPQLRRRFRRRNAQRRWRKLQPRPQVKI